MACDHARAAYGGADQRFNLLDRGRVKVRARLIEQQHLRLVQHGAKIRGVAFGGAEWLPHLPAPGQPFLIAFKPKINEFQGRRTAELELVDWRPDGIDVGTDLPQAATAAS